MGLRKEYASLNPLFDRFLCASIAAGENGMELTVMSALAQFGKDPWEEAARLAVLPKAKAVDAIVALLGWLPQGTWQFADRVATATRLVELLPSANGPVARPSQAPGRRRLVGRAMWLGWLILVVALVYFVSELVSQF